MNSTLRNRLFGAVGAGAIAVAGLLVSWHEGRVHTVYLDPVGVPTVCEGITGPDVIPGKRYSDAECDVLRDKHLKVAEAGARRLITRYDTLNVWTQAALIDWIYNVGEGNAAGSTLRAKFNRGDLSGGCAELVRWVKGRVKGRLITLRGLENRRADELEICMWGVKA